MKNVLISGGASGIGESLVKKFISEGYGVFFTYNTSYPKFAYYENLNPIKVDLSNMGDVEKLSNIISKNNIDIFINNAAISMKKNFLKITNEDLRLIMEVNVISAFKITQLVFNNMKKNNGGKIINIGSIGGQIGGKDQIHYAVSKGAIETLTKSIARIGFDSNIYSFNVSPGCIDTRMLNSLNSDISKLQESIPYGKIGNKQELASMIYSLCDDSWNYASGQTINYNGGLLL